MKCDFCHKKGITTGAIIEGKFGQACNACRSTQDRQASPASAEYNRERDRETHRKDMLQPNLPNGKPSPEFIKAYPSESKNYFTTKQIKENS